MGIDWSLKKILKPIIILSRLARIIQGLSLGWQVGCSLEPVQEQLAAHVA